MRAPIHLALVPALVLVTACSEFSSTHGPDHCGAIDDQVWGRDLSPHVVTCDVTVNGDLVIGPGARVQFAAGTSLIVQGSLTVDGTADDPVRFEASEDGVGWTGIWVRGWNAQNSTARPTFYEIVNSSPRGATSDAGSAQGEVSLSYLEISGAGVPSSNGSLNASLIVERGPVRMSEVSIDGSRQCGVQMGPAAMLSAMGEGTSLRVSGSGGPAICADARSVTHLPDGMDLGEGIIEVSGSTSMEGSHTWRNLGVPYRVTSGVGLISGDLTIEAGTTVELGADVGMTIGGDPGRTYGQAVGGDGPLTMDSRAHLHLAGTASEPVVFRPAVDGALWNRLRFEGGIARETTALLENVRLEGGGSGVTVDPATLEIDGESEITVVDVAIADGGGAGLRLKSGGSLSDESSGLTISGNAYPVFTAPEGLFSLPKDGSTYTGNNTPPSAGPREAGDHIYIESGVLNSSGTWPDVGVAYIAEGDIVLQQTVTGDQTSVVIEPGVEVGFPTDSGLDIGTGSNSVQVTIGDLAGEPVVMGPSGTNPWGGLVIGTGTVAGSSISNTVVTGAGSQQWAVVVDAEALKVDDFTISDSASGGLRLRGTMTEDSQDLAVTGSVAMAIESSVDSAASLPASGMAITGNGEEGAGDRVLLDGNFFTESGTWDDLGVPYRVDSQLRITGTVSPDEVITPARLTLAPGTVVEFAELSGLITNSLTNDLGEIDHGSVWAVGTVDDPVRFVEGDDGKSWTGLYLQDEDEEGVPEASRSHLENVVIDEAGGFAAHAALSMWSSTPYLENITVSNSTDHGVALMMEAFVDEIDVGAEDLVRCDRFTTDAFTFVNVAAEDVLDFRVFLTPGTDPLCL